MTLSQKLSILLIHHPFHPPHTPMNPMNIDPEHITHQIVDFIRQKMDQYERDGAILGMSGGVDSAVVASLLVRALGADKVLALLLPERDSSSSSKSDALLEIERLGISYRQVDLAPPLSSLGVYKLLPLQVLGPHHVKKALVLQQYKKQVDALGETPFRAGLLGTRSLDKQAGMLNAGNAYARVKHRMRMLILYYYADLENRLVIGTTNKSEAMTGFVVKWGDNVADIEPILPLYKTQVFQLARHLQVSPAIIAKPPSPDLIPGIVDELALGIEYAVLDRILWGLEHGWDEPRICQEAGVQPAQVAHVQEMQRRSEHLRQLPPVPALDFAVE